MRGVILATAAGVGFGVAQAINRRANRRLDPHRTTFVLFQVSLILLVLVTSSPAEVAALWFALTEAPEAVVLSLVLLSTPVVILAAPVVVGRRLEHTTPRVWAGAGAVFVGSIVLVFSGRGVSCPRGKRVGR